MITLSLKELKIKARSRDNKDYQSMPKDRLTNALNDSQSVESEKNFENTKIKEINKEFNKLTDRFSKPKIKEIEKNLLELEESLSKLKRYYDYDGIKYKGIRDVKNLFDMSIDKDYYKPIRTINVFDNTNNYIEYESERDKD